MAQQAATHIGGMNKHSNLVPIKSSRASKSLSREYEDSGTPGIMTQLGATHDRQTSPLDQHQDLNYLEASPTSFAAGSPGPSPRGHNHGSPSMRQSFRCSATTMQSGPLENPKHPSGQATARVARRKTNSPPWNNRSGER
jgi:hypothetical protein